MAYMNKIKYLQKQFKITSSLTFRAKSNGIPPPSRHGKSWPFKEPVNAEVACHSRKATVVVAAEVNLHPSATREATYSLSLLKPLAAAAVSAFCSSSQSTFFFFFFFLHHLSQITRTALCNPSLRDPESFRGIITSVSSVNGELTLRL